MNDGDPGRRVIDGRFELQGRLGGGGMGTVWRARDIVLNRAVALKEVRPPDPGLAEYDPQAARMLRDRVLREAQALARVEHPGVVTIHHIVDAGADTYPWLVMELVTGGSLADQLALGPMEPVAAARLGRDLLAALRAAHDVGIQHRDVKPANVLLRPDGRPVLTDFGIAAIRESTALTATGSIIGTPDYMAPERISGDEGGPASDLWSLAMLLYVAVEGAHPLRRGSTLATLAAVLSEPLPPPRRAGVLTAALSAVLVKDPTARPDAAGLHALLAAAADGTPSGPVPGATSSTSYHLAPPATATAPSSVPPPMPGFGPATPWPSDGTPHPAVAPTPYPVGPTAHPMAGPAGQTAHRTPGGGPWDSVPQVPSHGSHERGHAERTRSRVRGIAIGSSVAATVLAGVLAWNLVPGLGGTEDQGAHSPAPTTSGSRTGAPSVTKSADAPADTSGDSGKPATQNLLTPDGIRTALKALKEATGTDQVCDLTVYPEHVSAQVMVKGSKSRYDSWTYRPGEGAEKGIISGSVGPMDSPFSVDAFDWDVLPALLKRAEKELNVKDISSRYLLVTGDDPTFGDPKHMSVYVSNAYSQSGRIEADPAGKVTKVMPNEAKD
ncbi:protein kinase [Streptomyces sp. NPDC014746]|uniref:protein kinase domain-containing protein n=1 Tax=Streptomyces sp. NPDC014746 TaxID=3364904 RepID=UPI0036FA7611